MSLLKNLKTDDTITKERDSVGNGGPVDSGLHKCTIALAYLTKAASEALGLVLHLKTEEGREIRQTIYMTSGKEKGGQNFYTDKEGAKHYLPGFTLCNNLALLTTGKDIGDLDTETKVVNVYSKDAKAEVPTKVEMIVDMLGKEVIAGVIKQVVDKTQKNEATGKYEPTGETREENEIDKFFRARDRMTTVEILAQATEATFADTWDAKWTGKVRERAKGANAAGTPGMKGAAGSTGTKKPASSLFA